MDFKAMILAEKLKHVVDVLCTADSEARICIDGAGLSSSIANPISSFARAVTVPESAFIEYAPGTSREIGVDVQRMKQVLVRATKGDSVRLCVDDEYIQVIRGIHSRHIPLLKPGEISKVPSNIVPTTTFSVTMEGRDFKGIVAEAADVSNVLTVVVDGSTVQFESIGNQVLPESYGAELPCINKTGAPVSAMYDLDMLSLVSKSIQKRDTVTFKCADACPCEILYSRDGVDVATILAPRIPST